MADGTQNSSPRTRKMSWAEMVDEEEERMAKEAYETALKEREQKKRADKKKTEHNENTKVIQGTTQNEGMKPMPSSNASDRKGDQPSKVLDSQSQEVLVSASHSKTAEMRKKDYSATKAASSHAFPFPKADKGDGIPKLHNSQSREAFVKYSNRNTVQNPHQQHIVDKKGGGPSNVLGSQSQDGVLVSAFHSKTAETHKKDHSVMKAASSHAFRFSKDRKGDGPSKFLGSQRQEVLVSVSHSKTAATHKKDHSAMRAASSHSFSFPKADKGDSIPKLHNSQSHEAFVRYSNRNMVQKPHELHNVDRKGDEPSKVLGSQRQAVLVNASHVKAAETHKKDHSAMKAPSSHALSSPKLGKIEKSSQVKEAPAKISYSKIVQAPVAAAGASHEQDRKVYAPPAGRGLRSHDASLSVSNTKGIDTTHKQQSAMNVPSSPTAPVPKQDRKVYVPPAGRGLRSHDASLSVSNTKGIDTTHKQQSAMNVPSSPTAPVPKEEKVVSPSTAQGKASQESSVSASNSKPVQAPHEQQQIVEATSSPALPCSVGDAVCGPPAVQGSKSQEASEIASYSETDQAYHKQQSSEKVASNCTIPSPKQDRKVYVPPAGRGFRSHDASLSVSNTMGVDTTHKQQSAMNVPSSPTAPVPKADKVEQQLTSNNTYFTWAALESEVSTMTILKEALAKFVDLRDDLKSLVDDKKSFDEQVDEKLKEALVLFDTHEESAIREDKIGYWKTRGLMFMESAQYVHHAVDAFTKAVKLEPSSLECWNNLGECYCTLGDFIMSKKCFLTALDQKKNVLSLQNLSMLARLKKPRETGDYEEGIGYAKEALSLDFSCTRSWNILGNAYMAAFFAAGQNEIYIKKAVHAYRQAEKGAVIDFEVCINKFVALKFLELYEEALDTLLPSLNMLDFEWKTAQTKFLSLVDYLNQVQELITKKGKIRPKKRAEYVKLLKTRKPSAQELSAENDGFPRLTGIVIWILSPDKSFPYTVGILTASEEVLAVSIFNLSNNKGFTIGDTMNIPISTKSEVDIRICQHEFKFMKIRIFLPTDIILNGKRLTVKYLKPYQIVSN